MPAPGAPKGMGGMSPPGGEVPDEIAQMMGGSSGGSASSSSSGASSNPLAGGKVNSAQAAAMQQAMGGAGGGLPGTDGQAPRDVGTIKDEIKRGAKDLFEGFKDFFRINKWLGIEPAKLDPEQQANAKQLHSRYQQLNQEQQMVAKKMYEEKMQKKKMEEEQTARKKQMEAEQKAQSIEMPSGPQKGNKGQGGSKKQKAMTKLKQDRTTLSTTQGE